MDFQSIFCRRWVFGSGVMAIWERRRGSRSRLPGLGLRKSSLITLNGSLINYEPLRECVLKFNSWLLQNLPFLQVRNMVIGKIKPMQYSGIAESSWVLARDPSKCILKPGRGWKPQFLLYSDPFFSAHDLVWHIFDLLFFWSQLVRFEIVIYIGMSYVKWKYCKERLEIQMGGQTDLNFASYLYSS